MSAQGASFAILCHEGALALRSLPPMVKYRDNYLLLGWCDLRPLEEH